MAYIGIISATDSEQLSPNYIGFQPTRQQPETAFVVDTFTANGVQTIFPLSNPKPITSRALLVSLNGELKVPVLDYNLDNTGNIDFTVAPSAGTYITVHHLIFPKNEATTTIRKLDDISYQFNGVTTQFTLTANNVAAGLIGQNVLIVSIDGVIQEPGIAYTISGDEIIFSEPPSPVSNFYCIDMGSVGIGTPADESITSEKFLTDNYPSTGKVLGINSNGELSWITVTGGIGATNLDGLSDVDISSPLAGQVLKYNGSNFINARLNYVDLDGTPNLSAIAISGNYHDLSNTPIIPADLSDISDNNNLLFNKQYSSLTGLPNIPQTVADLLDTDIVNLTSDDVLIWNGSNWINDQLNLMDLGISDGTTGQVLTTNGAGVFSFIDTAGFSGSYNDLTDVPDFAVKNTGSWIIVPGTNNYNFTVPQNGTYSMWVRGNIPHGIIVWNATVTVTNTNVPVVGQQFAWNYTGGTSPLLFTSIPNHIIGTAGSIISTNTYVGSTANTFTFGINNTSGSNQTVYYGYTLL